MDELAAEEFRSIRVEQDDRDLLVDGQASLLEGDEVVRVGGPGPGIDGARLAPGSRGELVRRQAGRSGSPELLEQSELDPDVDQPRAVESAEARDQVVELFVERHRRPIVA